MGWYHRCSCKLEAAVVAGSSWIVCLLIQRTRRMSCFLMCLISLGSGMVLTCSCCCYDSLLLPLQCPLPVACPAAAYTSIVSQLFQRDPEGAVMAFADMMKKGIVMPAHFMDDGWHNSKGANSSKSHLFTDYATVADSIGVYTTGDYADIVQHLVRGVPAAASQVLMG